MDLVDELCEKQELLFNRLSQFIHILMDTGTGMF